MRLSSLPRSSGGKVYLMVMSLISEMLLSEFSLEDILELV